MMLINIVQKPMSIDKLQGLNSRINTVDEWLSGDVREDVIGALEQGASKNDDYLIVAISSEGTVRNGSGDTIKMELAKILKNEYRNPHVSIWWYKLDSIDEVGRPDLWLKANPNLDKTVTYETYQQDVDRAEQAPAAKNDILAKRFGIPLEGYTYYFTYEETLPHRRRDFWQMPCALGADLSQGDDFCSFSFLFPLRDGSFGIKSRNYISSLTLKKLPAAMRTKYDEFMKEGSLIILEGTVLDMMQVYDDLDQHIIDSAYDVRCFGFDPYGAKEFMSRWELENGPYGIEKVPQGAKTESIPLGELKKLSEERMLIFDEEIMTFAMGNCITLEDSNGKKDDGSTYEVAEISQYTGVDPAFTGKGSNMILKTQIGVRPQENLEEYEATIKMGAVFNGRNEIFSSITEEAENITLKGKDIYIKPTSNFNYDIPVRLSEDCDLLTFSGKYYLGNNCTNRPVDKNGWLECKQYSTDCCHQTYTTYTGEIYKRTMKNGTWGRWTQDSGPSGVMCDLGGVKMLHGTFVTKGDGDSSKQLFTISQLKTRFGIDSASQVNSTQFMVIVQNGNGGVTSVHMQGSTWLGDKCYAVFNNIVNTQTQIRINYLIIYTPSEYFGRYSI